MSATDENVTGTYEKMKSDSRYCPFVADVNGDAVGFAANEQERGIQTIENTNPEIKGDKTVNAKEPSENQQDYITDLNMDSEE